MSFPRLDIDIFPENSRASRISRTGGGALMVYSVLSIADMTAVWHTENAQERYISEALEATAESVIDDADIKTYCRDTPLLPGPFNLKHTDAWVTFLPLLGGLHTVNADPDTCDDFSQGLHRRLVEVKDDKGSYIGFVDETAEGAIDDPSLQSIYADGKLSYVTDDVGRYFDGSLLFTHETAHSSWDIRSESCAEVASFALFYTLIDYDGQPEAVQEFIDDYVSFRKSKTEEGSKYHVDHCDKPISELLAAH